MSLICENGLRSCNGCGECRSALDVCSVCKRTLSEGDKYYKLYGKIVCDSCTDEGDGSICMLCRKPSKNGFRYKDVTLCRSCSRVATGYSGYI